MLTHVGTQKIETERLILRHFEITDAEDMFNKWAGDSKNVKYMSFSAHKNVEETKEIIKNWIKNYEKNNYYHWIIILKENNELIGSVGAYLTGECIECVQLGYIISKKHWGKGIMTEALKVIINYLFEKVNFKRIQAYHHIDNTASGKVMEKCGMKYEGTHRKYEKNNKGELVDVKMYAILKEDRRIV